MWIYSYNQNSKAGNSQMDVSSCWLNEVQADLMAPFSTYFFSDIYFFLLIAQLTIDLYLIILSVKQVGIK